VKAPFLRTTERGKSFMVLIYPTDDLLSDCPLEFLTSRDHIPKISKDDAMKKKAILPANILRNVKLG